MRDRIAERLENIRDVSPDVHCVRMMDTHEMDYLARAIRDGFLDDILGKPEPTLEDVLEEARRVFGDDADVINDDETGALYVYENATWAERDTNEVKVSAPTVAAAYAALRTLPDKASP